MWLDFKLWFEEWWQVTVVRWYREVRLNYLLWKLDRLMKKIGYEDED